MKTNKREEILNKILSRVALEFQLGGLADGIYADYAREVAKRYLREILRILSKKKL